MDKDLVEALKSAGFTVGDASDFLGLTPAEGELIDIKLELRNFLRDQRKRADLTQAELADLMGSTQARVSIIEAGSSGTTTDLLIKGCLAAGATRQELAQVIAGATIRPPGQADTAATLRPMAEIGGRAVRSK